ncbi:6-pyruvoyl trahydropterin synthase family protein [Congregibacter litoralis]|uniref:6-carboxy-5,6,7,8-tetrahydropterin synthase n=1 Tax=Congregibacter litoralis KT71 TaxID=314285 RepID=A4ACK7_9GAMM|nr:6-carboxytetrahydropterin synthase [Congregibacter litoralis]EAQ96221.1 6-pyruvoyl-tetrahydropterin synthase [Congregibacter litoralis KT71]
MERLATLYIDKESHKFSAAHYTIFSATERERLHGHNFSVSAMIAAPMGDNGFAADYNVYKRRIKGLCDELDEYMVLPGHSPYQSVVEDGDNYRVSFNGEDMWFLRSDTLVLPIVNSTVEEFAHYLLRRMLEESAGEALAELEICVASGPGQKGSARWSAMDEGIA